MVCGGDGTRRLTKSVIDTWAVKVGAEVGDGSAWGASAATPALGDPASAASMPEVGSHSVPLNDDRVPTCQ